MGRADLEVDVAAVSVHAFDADDFPILTPDSFGEKGETPYEHLSPFGLWSIPFPTDSNGACQAFFATKGSDSFAWLANDPRAQAKLPKLAPGDAMLHSYSGAFMRAHADGRLSLFTTDDNTPNGRSVTLQVNPDGFVRSFPGGVERFGNDGWHMRHISGARIDCGAINGIPAPLDAISSYAKIQAHMVKIAGSVVTIGSGLGAPSPAAKATPLMATLTAVSTALGGASAAFAALASVPVIAANPAAVTALGAAETAIAAAVSAIAAAATTVPAATVSVE